MLRKINWAFHRPEVKEGEMKELDIIAIWIAERSYDLGVQASNGEGLSDYWLVEDKVNKIKEVASHHLKKYVSKERQRFYEKGSSDWRGKMRDINEKFPR